MLQICRWLNELLSSGKILIYCRKRTKFNDYFSLTEKVPQIRFFVKKKNRDNI